MDIITQNARQEVLSLGSKKYAQLRKKADKLIMGTIGRDFTDKERAKFLSLPLAIRVLAVNEPLL